MGFTVSRVHNEQQKIYVDFVAAHESGTFLQSWSWGDFQTSQGKNAIRYAVFLDKDLVATIQLLQTKIPRMPGMYLYAPYGPLIKEEYDSETKFQIAHELISQIKKEFSRAWFIRIEPKNETAIDGKPTLHIQPGSTLITDLSLSDEQLLNGMHTKTRYNIKVAKKHGVNIVVNSAKQEEAISLLSETSKRQGYKSHTAQYYLKMLEYFKKQNNSIDCAVVLYEAKLNDVTIASAIMIDSGTTRTYLFGGSDQARKNVMAPYALHWQAILDAKQKGFKNYDWWGTETASGAAPGFVQFKLRWGGTQKFYAGARDVVLNSNWYRAYNALRKVNRFF